MSRLENKIAKLLDKDSVITFTEVSSILQALGYNMSTRGRTSGSAICFYREIDELKIMLHKPHPGDDMKKYAKKQVLQVLIQNGDISKGGKLIVK